MADHSHTHHHGHNKGDSLTENNRAMWDEYSSKYMAEPWQKELVARVTAFMQANLAFIDDRLAAGPADKDSTYRVLDYACGPGTVTNAFGAHATEFIGVDLSGGMVQAYNARFASTTEASNDDDDKGGPNKPKAHAIIGNLLDDSSLASSSALAAPELSGFDLAVVGMGFHHFERVDVATQRLVDRLKPGGVLVVIDVVSHAKEEGPAAHTIAHNGFGEEQVRGLFEAAGLVDVRLTIMEGTMEMGKLAPKTAFMARGSKG